MEYTSGGSSWTHALRRLGRAMLPHRAPKRGFGWSWLTPVVLVVAGMLFSLSAATAKGTDLRDDRRPELTNLLTERKKEIADARDRAARLRAAIDRQQKAQAGTDGKVDEQRRRGDAEQAAAGLTAVHGPGLTVVLNDAPRRADGTRPAGATPDDLVVHQQDVQAVVNALWAGGAEAMTLMGVRVISTSAVRCVGNTLLLDGQVYSPPFEIAAIGDQAAMQRALNASEGVRLFSEAADSFGLGYAVKTQADIHAPAYNGSTALRAARAGS
ncbi:DUF881 domain-containing protein [Dactylosporangium matsuzakiense]|nr:DUF881 domain-containing protein [Dactylosporangium matsuzakiense]UWZ49249.1 DUF881 domain-containing protein [Dactylosporangium matsuzakiense]